MADVSSTSFMQPIQGKRGEPTTATPAAVTKPVEGASDGATAAAPTNDPFWSTDKGRQQLEAVRSNTAGEYLR